MKILLVNKFFYHKGGAEKVFFDTIELLESHGHEVAVFAIEHPKNLPSQYSKYFADFTESENLNLWQGIKLWLRSVYSFSNARKLEELIKDFKPEVAHVHNIYHQLSPSVLRMLKKHNIPVVMSAHDYKVVCPTYHLNKDGLMCPKNNWLHAWQATRHKTHYKNSFTYSLGQALEWLIHKFFKVYEKNIDLLLVPSEFMAKNLIAYGWPKDKLKVLPHFTNLSVLADQDKQSASAYVFYAGRLTPEKGIDILAEVARLLPDTRFVVASSDENNLPNLPNLEFVGFKTGNELSQLYRNATLFFAPSKAQETFGLSVLESMAQGTPVVVSNKGALPELVRESFTGKLFDPGEPAAAKKAAALISDLMADDRQVKRLGVNAAQFVKENYTAEKHYPELCNVYLSLLNNKSV